MTELDETQEQELELGEIPRLGSTSLNVYWHPELNIVVKTVNMDAVPNYFPMKRAALSFDTSNSSSPEMHAVGLLKSRIFGIKNRTSMGGDAFAASEIEKIQAKIDFLEELESTRGERDE